MSGPTIAERLAAYAASLEYDDLPESVVVQAKRCLLDTIGVALAGFGTDLGRAFSSLVMEWGGSGEATVFGDGMRVPAVNAALANGAMGHIHELDDGHRFAMGHPGVTSIPAAVAVAERAGATGRELIAATVLGYDAFVRVATAINPSHRGRGFHTTGTCGTFAAAAAAGKALGLDEERIANALGIAGVQAAGLMEVMRGESMIKPLNAGRAAQNGVLAALLAERGVTAPTTIFEGGDGFLGAYSDDYEAQRIVDDLSGDYHIMGTYVKLHAACRHAHPAIDCALELAREHGLDPEAVERVVVRTYSAAHRLTGTEYEPRTVSTAKFSTPYCVAAALTHGRISPDEFTAEKIADPRLLGLAKRVEVVVDPEIDRLAPEKRGASVEISVKGGPKYEWAVENPRGEPENPVSREELEDKFRSLVGPILGAGNVQRIIDVVADIESLEDVGELTLLLS